MSVGAALVTGAGSGIGRATAPALAAEGRAVLCCDRDAAAAAATAREAGGRSAFAAFDVRDERATAEAMRAADALGGLDAVAAVAGVQVETPAPAEETSLDAFRRVVEINLTGAFVTARAAAQVMLPRGRGALALVGSIAARAPPVSGVAPYAASKGGVEALARALAREWGPRGLRVNAIAPGIVATPMTAGRLADPDRRAALANRAALGRIGDPDEIAAAIAFLLSPQARFVAGAVLAADGGWLA